jgi:hypothetical protein
VGVYIASGSSALLAATFGERVQAGLMAVCPPGLDVRPDDEVVALSGTRTGSRYRVIDEPEGEGSASPVLLMLERMREDA